MSEWQPDGDMASPRGSALAGARNGEADAAFQSGYRWGVRYALRRHRGFMCKTDFDSELGHATDGDKVYPSVDALKAERECVVECGVVEVEVSLVRVVAYENRRERSEPRSEAERIPNSDPPKTESGE
jgi:hypothetical protein